MSEHREIVSSYEQFDINAPLTEDEIKAYAGVVEEKPEQEAPLLKDMDESEEETPTETPAKNSNDYNTQYAYYMKCQALASLVSFEDGWKSLEELVIKPYLSLRRREDSEYRGDEPNKAFSLRLRRQEADDFFKHIKAAIAELIATPKPTLSNK